MEYRPPNVWFGTLLVLLALMSVLLAPLAAISHAGQNATPAAMSDQHHDGCDDHHSQPADDDCCASSACSCACHAPLLTTLPLPAALLLAGYVTAREPDYRLPTVYLAIFVPPQNRS